MAEVPVLLLAAGSSARMGQPKQLLPWGNQTLIEYQIRKLLKTGQPLSVILGAGTDRIIPVIKNFKLNIVVNQQWEKGIGSSIAAGVDHLTNTFPPADGVLITLLDQPLVTVGHLEEMLRIFQPGKQQIIVSRSTSGWQGVPVLFDPHYFEELKNLSGDTGAKSIILQYSNEVFHVDCNDMLEDMDTPESYRRMVKKIKEIT